MKAKRLRLTFVRGDEARELSHREMMRALEQAMREVGLPLAYTESRRATAQILRRPWKRLLADDYDLHVSNEFYGLQFSNPKHDFEKITKSFDK